MKKLMVVLFSLMAVAFSARASFPDTVVVNGMTFRVVSASNAVLMSADVASLTGEVDIPSYVLSNDTTCLVRAIGPKAFENAVNVTKFNLPATIAVIGKKAFAGCTSLQKLPNLTNVTTMQDSVFAGNTSISGTIVLPSNLATLGYGMFSGCTGITTVYYNCRNAARQSSSTNTTKTLLADMPNIVNLIIGPAVTNLPVAMFANCNMRHLVLSSSVSFPAELFTDCNNLTFVTISANVDVLGSDAFFTLPSIDSVSIRAIDSLAIQPTSFNGNSIRSLGVPSSSLSHYQGDARWMAFIYPDNTNINGTSDALTYSLTVSSDNASFGTVTGSVAAASERSATGYTITATPQSGCHFESWSDGDRTATRVINMVSDLALTAYFSQDTIKGLKDTVCADGTTYINDTTIYHSVSGGKVAEVKVTVLHAYNDTVTDAMRASSYTWRSRTLTATGVYSDTVLATSGSCDSVFSIRLVACDTVIDTVEQPFVDGGTNLWYGETHSAAGYYEHHVAVATGSVCDSSITLNLVNTSYRTVRAMPAQSNMGSATVVGSANVILGNTATVKATANAGYRFTRWNNGSTSNPMSFTVTQDTLMLAYFEPVLYNLTVTSNQPNMGAASGGGQFARGAARTIAATPFHGYRFSSWNDGDTNVQRTITVMGDTTFSASFEARRYNVNLITSNYAQGSVTGNGTYAYRSYITIEATPRNGFAFSHWSDGDRSNPRRIMVVSDTTLVANFIPTVQKHYLSVVSNDSTKGDVRGSGYYDDSMNVVFSATAFAGNRFVQWADGVTANPRTVLLTSDTVMTAVFEAYDAPATYTITVSCNDNNLGQVSGGGTYEQGDTIMVVAYPAPRCHLVRWSDGHTMNPLMVIVSSDMNITAMFAHDSATITVISADESMGTVSGGGTYPLGTQITITATPKRGFRFSHWNTADGTNPLSVTANYSRTYVALFEPEYQGIDETDVATGNVWGSGMMIYTEGCENQPVRIYDVTGRLVVNDKYGRKSYAMSEPGVYVVVADDKLYKVVLMR